MSNLHTADDNDDNVSVTTWNLAASYGTVKDPLVELFFKSVRNVPCTDYRCINIKDKSSIHHNGIKNKSLEDYFDNSWKSDALLTLRFLFYLRDCRKGKGEKALFRSLIRHMRDNNLEKHIIKNLHHIPTFGSWKDISICFFGTKLEQHAVKLIAKQLTQDLKSDVPSLCAKYAPSEGGAIDKKHNAASKISKELGVNLTHYRKKYLTPLRSKLNIVERNMCSKDWASIDYEKVPSIASGKYKKSFKTHDEERYREYIQSVQKGEKKMNTSVLMPYQIVSNYLNCGFVNLDETVEAQWKSFVDGRIDKWPKGVDVMPIVDVSGSMFCCTNNVKPIEVAISLGLLFAKLNSSENYKNTFITFSNNPQFVKIVEGSLYDQVMQLKKADWGMSTNFQAVFDLILNVAKTFNLSQENLPKILLVLSDMQFNGADNGKTNWENINRKYQESGYVRPTIIFWNLQGASIDFPIPDANIKDCALLSGFNDSILYKILEGTLPNPLEIVKEVLNDPRYNVIELA